MRRFWPSPGTTRGGFVLGLLLASGALLAACTTYPDPETGILPGRERLPLHAEPQPEAAPETLEGASFLETFDGPHDPTRWTRSNLNYPSDFHPAWLSRHVHHTPGRLELELARRRVDGKTLAGGEYQRRGFYHFGRYEVVMRAAPGSGTVSAMFTHTHGQFGDPHDEIDIEFLGRDARMVTFNYYTDGRQHGTIGIPVPYDTTREAHLYAFDWEPDRIRWYVNDTLVHTSTPEDHPIPQSPGRLILQVWSGGPGQYAWHGPPTFHNHTRAAYSCVSFQRAGDMAPQCSDTFVPPGD
ncbi:family 16 glycosylhydrolase [Hyphomonas sp.]|uniref:family 16 glycosylhydrolase n=1 Tax=Hyphomonas sp. TaxID=87 RepID=UPI003919C854